jgi:cytochrome c553
MRVPLAAAGLLLAAAPVTAAPIDFNRDIRPILATHCYACHGPDEKARKAELRLDVRDAAVKAGVIVPGEPDKSELIRRVTAKDPEEQMPPARSKKPLLTPAQVATFKQWIAEGAKYSEHWSFAKLTRPSVPEIRSPKFEIRTPVDAFVLYRLDQEGMKPAPQADRVTLIRRLSFDLTGLPPTPEEVRAFVADQAPDAYEKVVDRLLSSPHYGERMAVFWLDLVRFADSIGYHSDNPMNVAPYRDYVIASFYHNKPFDQFTTEQLAGDLLPNPTREQKIATAYNRLLQTTEEGGAQAKEYEAKYAADRVRNFGQVWLGGTIMCAECHNHKFDPYTQKDFYSLAAFFADVQEGAVGRREPGMLVPTPEQEKKLAELTAAADAAEARFRARAAVIPMAALKADRDAVAATAKAKADFENTIPRVLITTAGPPRTVRLLPRGNWLDTSGPVVTPNTPGFLPPLPPLAAGTGRYTRLDLAKWTVSPENPLTARVFVNRTWKLFFGYGISRSLEESGAQGQLPTHPELLDWLAAEFQNGWDVKKLVRLLVTSSAYRQSSVETPAIREKDPGNRLYARQSRWRLDAEFVRDNALSISGLLVRDVGGPSVKPYQPPGYWSALNFPVREWQNDTGPKIYRRGLYTHWQRTFLHPAMLAFDAPSREEATCERPRSNIPQQALVLLNDPEFVEAARAFAAKTLAEGGKDDGARAAWAFERATSRLPRPEESKVLLGLLAKHRKDYAADPKAAEELLKLGDTPAPKDVPTAELAAWTSVCRVLLNLHETMTRQ